MKGSFPGYRGYKGVYGEFSISCYAIMYVFRSHSAAAEIEREWVIFVVERISTQQHGTEDDQTNLFYGHMGI